MNDPLQQLNNILDRSKPLGLLALKAEFESEGVRIDEYLTLNSIARMNDLGVALKVGGSEAKTDMYLAINSIATWVIAPMIESPYSALKCLEAYTNCLEKASYSSTKLLVNIETKTAMQNIEPICDSLQGIATGIVFGRVDFTLSSGFSRNDINCDHVNNSVLQASRVAKDRNLEFVLGGGISIASLDLLNEVSKIRLNRFETRKCVLSSSSLSDPNISTLLKNCVFVELLWLKSKSEYYSAISSEDKSRIHMLEQRHLYKQKNKR